MGRKIPMWQCVLTIVAMVVFLFWNVMKDDGGEAHGGLIMAALVAGIIGAANGWKWSYMEQGILAAINRSMQAMLILACVGAMIGCWKAGGVIPSMMFYGIKVISPSVFLFTACLLCSIISLATGSSWSTAGSMGVALIGIGAALGFPDYMTAGAIVSGAYFGDKMSPLSDTTNLAPAIAGSTLFEHIKHMVYTVGPSLIIAFIVYLVLGFTHKGGSADESQITMILDFISSNFTVGLLYLIPPVFVIVAVIVKMPALPALVVGALLGIPFMALQGLKIFPSGGESSVVFNIINNGLSDLPSGYVAPEDDLLMTKLCALLTGGGLQSMMWTISLIMLAMCFGGIVDVTGIMGNLAAAALKLARGTRGGLVIVTELSCVFVNAICCDQYLSIILPGRMYKEAFEDRRLKAKNLSRCLEDSGTITSNFFPWNTCGATMRSFLQVNSAYIPFAVLNWVNPLVSMFYGITGITMEEMTEEEYQKILEEREAERQAALEAVEA
ncbi:MAG: Na+/H+ antiporter NhaC [Firmicutes bacterium]|nr:Na+/H+ antiporter NhaC [Bacillota bacterium]